ncbi:MAG TPA: metalloregulator ArsR/SmtB family transcription factor [Phycisphaerae bacterium]|nr:metalloregulator ArsR/SmtB family transcription factor [Phycisphaerae bacterium]HRY71167.1 metalloregulator ArsR/SmtB family transcription factor [Phycisphaerae bacterium]HSA29891.1 metalloregulator ArsR/SmtB family transcription factor [Phycisphaerae bacterium]
MMRQFLTMARAIGDESRVRALLALRDGELCLCQIIELLQLAPSTVSKHMDVLYQSGLVERRKEGRWHYFRLAGNQAAPMVRRAIKWVLESLQDEATALGDTKKLCCLREKDLKRLSACYKV